MLHCLTEFQRMGQECFLSSIVLAFINKLSLTKKTKPKKKKQTVSKYTAHNAVTVNYEMLQDTKGN